VTFTVRSTTAGAVVFTATDATDSLTITQTATVTFTAGGVSASVSTVSASPASVTADGTATSTVTVTLKDANGNGVSGKTVTLAKTSGPGAPTISAASGASDGSGVVTFTVRSTTAGAVVFTATDATDSLTITQTATVTFTAGAANKLAFTTQPVGGASGAVLSTQPVVKVQDAQGNTVTGDNATQVTLAIQSGAGGTLGGTVTVTASGGVATFTNVTLAGEAGTSYVLRATSSPPLAFADSNGVMATAASFTVTSVPGVNGTLSCSSPVLSGQTSSCSATPNSGFRTRRISGCGGVVTGVGVNSYITAPITSSCSVTAEFELIPLGNACQGGTVWTGVTVPGAGGIPGTGSASFCAPQCGGACAFDPAETAFVAAPGTSSPGASLPHGMFKFKLVGCTPGCTARVTVTWPGLEGLQVLKYGSPSAGAAPVLFNLRNPAINGNSVSFDVTDGQQGDEDFSENGEIVDPIAPVLFEPVVVPTLDWRALLALIALLMTAGALHGRRWPALWAGARAPRR